MINRYSTPELNHIWSDENKYKIWLDIEIYACEAQEILGVIPKNIAKKTRELAQFDVNRIHQIEAEVKHDVIAFLTNIAEHVGEDSRFIHQGLTSSDILDTCLSFQLKQAGEILLKDLDLLLEITKRRAYEHKYTITVGRSHGIHAEPVTFGLKMARFYKELERNKKRLVSAVEDISICAISGAVGTHANIDPFVQDYVAEKMNMNSEDISTQIIPRDRYAFFFSVLGVIASSVENIATEIRHLQRTEVLEAEEYFSAGQKGSSAMPHKRNPVLSENLTGLARIVRSYVVPALENVASWHERDISHSSVERVIAPSATTTLDFALKRLANVLDNLVVYPERMEANMNKLNGLIYSQKILLELTQKGISREIAYRVVQRNAMKVWNDNSKNFLDELIADEEVTIADDELKEMFSIEYHTKNIDKIFKKVFV